jgi:predicted alpha-1,2-mannosidase
MKKLFVAILTTSMLVSCLAPSGVRQLTDRVNPFLGTETLWDSVELGFHPTRRTWGAEVYPGSSLPNAMVQVSPVTMFRSGAGYQYEDTLILGFSHTNKGHWNLNHIPVLPIRGEVSVDDYGSKYSHDRESARPAYYSVYLERYGVEVELTSTLRAAYHRYTWDEKGERSVMFNMPRSNERVNDYAIEKVAENEFSGYQHTGRQTLYFYAVANDKVVGIDEISKDNGGLIGDSPDAAGADPRHRRRYMKPIPVVRFEPSSKPLELKIGFSFVSVEGAKANLEAEMLGKSFAQVKKEGNAIWNELLGKIQVEGGTETQKNLFYTTMYRSMLWPALRSDVDGTFKDPKGEVRNEGFHYYTEPSFWDDYRNKLVLLGMLSPKVANDVISSCLVMGEANHGFMPTFFHGDHASVFVTGSYLRGLRDYDVQKAYAMMLKNATVEGPSRPYLQEYIDKGYTSEVELKGFIEIHADAKASVTKTQEYSYDDYAVALLARELGDMESHDMLMKRVHNYKNVFDKSVLLARGKLADGRWVENFDPCFPYYQYLYREATGWMSSFFAPHDTEGLIELFGGPEIFERQLDEFYTLPWKGYEAHNLSGFVGQYCHGNQPDHTAPFLYYFIGKPEKSQALIDYLLNNFYSMGEHDLAYAGMDDAGEMSSWFVMSAIGLYTYSPADPEYLVTVPLFDKVTFELGEKPFTVIREGESRVMKAVECNGKPLEGLFVDHASLAEGAVLKVMTE